ncbi:hypothetical protein ACFCZ1_10715 [Streptomyces sp. NPDC056224]|uniref:hypothetical protein n=1 Tax=Streptomyces sp. NPDC056224 TaxID=3345750 RepID=UPI0035E1C73E
MAVRLLDASPGLPAGQWLPMAAERGPGFGYGADGLMPFPRALDRFLGGLVWDGPDGAAGAGPDDGPPPAGGFPDDPAPWRPEVLLLRAPDEVPALVRAWERAAPRLEELRGPFGTEAAGWAARPATFDGAVALMHEWGEVVTRAGVRGWGLVGAPVAIPQPGSRRAAGVGRRS